MEIKLNFQADKPTLNGHVYPKEVLKKALDESVSKELSIVRSCDDFDGLKPIQPIGKTKSYNIDPDNEITLNIETNYPKELKDCKLTTFGHGKIDENQIVTEIKLHGFFIDPESIKEK